MKSNSEDCVRLYQILDGSKTIDKISFLEEIGILLKFPQPFETTWEALNENLKNLEENFKDFWEDATIDQINLIWENPKEFSNNSEDFNMAVKALKEAVNYSPIKFVVTISADINDILGI
jgi:cytochrome c556